jgi:hypothetical protein
MIDSRPGELKERLHRYLPLWFQNCLSKLAMEYLGCEWIVGDTEVAAATNLDERMIADALTKDPRGAAYLVLSLPRHG